MVQKPLTAKELHEASETSHGAAGVLGVVTGTAAGMSHHMVGTSKTMDLAVALASAAAAGRLFLRGYAKAAEAERTEQQSQRK
ncbi:MAG TPA: hypothetical protein VL944_03370 [Candidatus Acidoferrum sp.]|nr:hypothetical protein [Candidatus Acidoferrum sp.]